MAETLRGAVRVEGLTETLRAFKELPKEASQELRVQTNEISDFIAMRVRQAGKAHSRQAALVADSVKSYKGRTPEVGGGGMKRVGSNRQPVHKILFGAEFGSNTLRQFKPHRGQMGYWFFSTVEDNKDELYEAWLDVVDHVASLFEGSGS